MRGIFFGEGIGRIPATVWPYLKGMFIDLPGVDSPEGISIPENITVRVNQRLLTSDGSQIFSEPVDKPWSSALYRVMRWSAKGAALMAFQSGFAGLFQRVLPMRPLFSFRHIGMLGAVGLVAHTLNTYLYKKRSMGSAQKPAYATAQQFNRMMSLVKG